MGYYLCSIDSEHISFIPNTPGTYYFSLSSESESETNGFGFCKTGDYVFLFESESNLCRLVIQIAEVSSKEIKAKIIQRNDIGVSISDYLKGEDETHIEIELDDVRSIISRLVEANFSIADTQINISQKKTSKSENGAFPLNCIFYGVPGSGKSHMIDKLLNGKDLPANRKRRVVFHPDYSNADFVGQILPTKKDGEIEYEFKEGPFTSILKAANESEDDFYLIIEEINRGNAAAIFGDIFQLLDRDDDGGSKFEISNKDIWQSIHGKEKEDPEGVYSVRLPRNLSILATMNTSDQNVFTLDNAFQRRWNMIHVKNKFSDDEKDVDSTTQREAKIESTNLTWEQFLFGGSNGNEIGINGIISESSHNNGMSSLEDKRLGCWFVRNKAGVITKDVFSNKVLKYLWDDAFHLDKDVFAEGISSFDELVEAFEDKKPLFKNLVIPYENKQ